MLIVTLQHPSPYDDDSYSVNSTNNGPFSDAIVQELIPAVETRFRAKREPRTRLLTGGWISLAKQTMYPDFYGMSGPCARMQLTSATTRSPTSTPTPTPLPGKPTLDDYRRRADRLNAAGRRARARDSWIGFHNHAGDFTRIDGMVPYDLLAERTDPSFVRLQLDTGNLAMAGRDPLDYRRRFGSRYWSFHMKDVPRLGAPSDTDLGKGTLDFRGILASIDALDGKLLFVEQKTYPSGSPLESVRRDYAYISALEF